VLKRINEAGLPLPDAGQENIAEGDKIVARPDFIYRSNGHPILIFVDGPDHDTDAQRRDDEKKRDRLDLMGYTVFAISYRDEEDRWINALSELLYQ